jgi:hypothetical protein
VPGAARVVERPFASHAQQLGSIDGGDGRPADPVIAQRVHDRQPFIVGDDARTLHGRVDHAGDKQQDERGHDGQVIPALHGQVDQVAAANSTHIHQTTTATDNRNVCRSADA